MEVLVLRNTGAKEESNGKNNEFNDLIAHFVNNQSTESVDIIKISQAVSMIPDNDSLLYYGIHLSCYHYGIPFQESLPLLTLLKNMKFS